MKIILALIAALLLFNASEIKAEVQEGTPVANFLSVLPFGEYTGVSNVNGKACYISVQPALNEAVFVVVTGGNDIRKNIKVDNYSQSFFNEDKQDFRLSKRLDFGVKYIESAIRTYRAANGFLYVSVHYVNYASSVGPKDKAECVLSPATI